MTAQAGLSWSSNGRALMLSPGKAPPDKQMSYAGPFRVQAKSWTLTHNLTPQPQQDSLMLSLEIVSEPSPRLLSVGFPRIVEARTSAGDSLPSLSTPTFAGPLLPLFPHARWVSLKVPPKRGGSLQVLRIALPVEVATDPRRLVVIDDLTKAAGKLYPIEGAGQLHIHTIAKTDRGATIGVTLPSNALWAYDPSMYQFELTDAKGRQYSSHSAAKLHDVRADAPGGWFAPDGRAPAAGLGALPWAGLVLHRPPLGQISAWGGNLIFTARGDMGPPARLILSRVRRMKAEVSFEFHDLPLP